MLLIWRRIDLDGYANPSGSHKSHIKDPDPHRRRWAQLASFFLDLHHLNRSATTLIRWRPVGGQAFGARSFCKLPPVLRQQIQLVHPLFEIAGIGRIGRVIRNSGRAPPAAFVLSFAPWLVFPPLDILPTEDALGRQSIELMACR